MPQIRGFTGVALCACGSQIRDEEIIFRLKKQNKQKKTYYISAPHMEPFFFPSCSDYFGIAQFNTFLFLFFVFFKVQLGRWLSSKTLMWLVYKQEPAYCRSLQILHIWPFHLTPFSPVFEQGLQLLAVYKLEVECVPFMAPLPPGTLLEGHIMQLHKWLMAVWLCVCVCVCETSPRAIINNLVKCKVNTVCICVCTCMHVFFFHFFLLGCCAYVCLPGRCARYHPTLPPSLCSELDRNPGRLPGSAHSWALAMSPSSKVPK